MKGLSRLLRIPSYRSCQLFSTQTSVDTEAFRPGQHKTPVTDHLWRLRQSVAAEIKEKKLRLAAATMQPLPELFPQPPHESAVTYAFSKDASLRETYVNPWGTIRVGRVLEDLDALAGNVAFRHCAAGNDPDAIMLVTASIDRIVLEHRPNLKDDVTLRGLSVIF
jgi:acyl-coenzyme A thioesterase 9